MGYCSPRVRRYEIASSCHGVIVYPFVRGSLVRFCSFWRVHVVVNNDDSSS